ncbi:MAG: UPF0280 family protein [Bacteroidales bacterium]|nr:UPF0280 family protein [Bacteroidales bacterium]
MDRVYRKRMSLDDFDHIRVQYLDTDVWIGVPLKSKLNDIDNYAYDTIRSIRTQLDNYIRDFPDFQKSHEPVKTGLTEIEVVNKMIFSANRAGVGPMAAVAGAMAESLGRSIMKNYQLEEIIVENGGDIFLQVHREMNVSVYAGGSPLSDLVGILIPEHSGPLGICTSSASVGHSFSYGKADAVMVVASDCALSDAYATSICNKIKNECDIALILEEIKQTKDIISCLIIMNDKMGIMGKFEMKIFKK